MSEDAIHDEFAERQAVEEFDDKSQLFVGKVFEVPDKIWDFEKYDLSSRPAACVSAFSKRQTAQLSKGTGQDPGRRRYGYVTIDPSDKNGLTKRTFFSIGPPANLRFRKLELYLHDRVRGELSEDELQRIRLGMLEFTREDS